MAASPNHCIFTESRGLIEEGTRVLKKKLLSWQRFLKKTFSKITSKLENRYVELEYIVKEGDNYESIINEIKIM